MDLQIYISLNSSQSFFKKEAVLISDSCGAENNICDITVQPGQDNVNQPQVWLQTLLIFGSGRTPHLWNALMCCLCVHNCIAFCNTSVAALSARL